MKFSPERPVMVCGIIGPTIGNVYYHVDTRSFNAADMGLILREIRQQVGTLKKLALVLDNACMHRARSVRTVAESPEVDIKLIFNVTGRPDLATVGIENVWSICKHIYRSSVDKLKAANIPIRQ
ncbi:MAG: transposase [Gammaproteobacteria bacterium]|nr:transposase [Gammaproteobacteria bacterium]